MPLTRSHRAASVLIPAALLACSPVSGAAAQLKGRATDEATQAPVPVRLTIQNAQGRFFFARSADAEGSAVVYDKANPQNRLSVERHTTLSPHPFVAELPPGRYTLTAEHGKEFMPAIASLELGESPAEVELRLRRWVNLPDLGWYSGDTHVHRSLAELPNVVAAEDLNVALPLTDWVTRAFEAPARGDKSSDSPHAGSLIRVDDTHVIYPRNTEYEIFTVNGRRHTLGAVFVLNHREPLELGAPPVGPVAKQARAQGALLDLDKHNWPWSMAIVPIMKVDLFELSNNHVWQAPFAFTNWSLAPPAYMNLPSGHRFGAERDWLEFGFQTYYALLNCGYRLRPSAGTASGVHPVPLGHSRVYVHVEGPFSYEKWIRGLDAGRSFVTTGPLILATLDGRHPGHVFARQPEDPPLRLDATILSLNPLASIEVLANGRLLHQIDSPTSQSRSEGGWVTSMSWELPLNHSSWVAVRCFESRPNDRFRFAHTGPFHVEIPGRPLSPRPEERQYLIQCVEEELTRSRPVLPADAVAEYEAALAELRALPSQP